MRTIFRDIVGAFIFSADGKLVVGHNINGGVYADKWVIPGGGIEPGETEIEALRREVQEEIGLNIGDAAIEIIDTKMKGSSEKILKETGERVIVEMDFHSYTVRLSTKSDDTILINGDGFGDVKWLSPGEFDEKLFSDPTVQNLRYLGYSL